MDLCFFPLFGVVRSCDGFGQLILVHVSCTLSAEHVKGGFYFLDFKVKVYIHDMGLCTASTISQACDPT